MTGQTVIRLISVSGGGCNPGLSFDLAPLLKQCRLYGWVFCCQRVILATRRSSTNRGNDTAEDVETGKSICSFPQTGAVWNFFPSALFVFKPPREPNVYAGSAVSPFPTPLPCTEFKQGEIGVAMRTKKCGVRDERGNGTSRRSGGRPGLVNARCCRLDSNTASIEDKLDCKLVTPPDNPHHS